jgi:acetyl esterase/lipase
VTRVVLVASLLAGVLAVGPSTPTAARACVPDTALERDVAYGPDPLQRLDVFPAAADHCGENPVVVWVHGGGFVTGDKARLHAKRAWAAANGWTLVSVNYRLSRPEDPPARRVRYPKHARDVARAMAWVVDHIAERGGDPTRIALVGHSAGAQLVSTVGVDRTLVRRDVRPALCGVVSLDTEGYDVAARIRSGDRAAFIYRLAFGDDPRTWHRASPIRLLDRWDAPHLVVRRGTAGRQRGQIAFAQALRAKGVPTTVVATPGWSHEDVNVRLGTEDTVLTPRVEAFLDDCFA